MPDTLDAAINLDSKRYRRLRVRKADRFRFAEFQRIKVEYRSDFFIKDIPLHRLFQKYGEVDHDKILDWSGGQGAKVQYRLSPQSDGVIEMNILAISPKKAG